MRYRASSLCIVRRREAILLEQFPEENDVITFRPLGGTIEYGEDSKSAVIREVKEEINMDIIEAKLIGIIENIYPWYDQIGHEYDFIYEASFICSDDYEKDVFEGVEGDKRFLAVWKNLSDFKGNPQYKLVPDGLYEMLTSEQNSLSEIKHINTIDLFAF
ncbi:NUDIX hydrolase [Paenibacillus eucommiae]|uniref:8-oxo-dGTP pyrophosphatase MutT (NUDIX family) n=1 Tax=Paenibacillus eucommiae TaxID=1355755 RepID=A0ABS4ISR1_9BACL|nr:NUDIX domain-containing protein [Paenibacillus eucommiae]MBP1989624.1 8-oxo-dGTP pyrophosphatase MutT (NUDIX family) [Paenibacillus eucommiae]